MISRSLRAITSDTKTAARHLWFNTIAGSALVPRPLRWLMWRTGGMDIRTMRVSPGAKITGTALEIGRKTFINHGVYLDSSRGVVAIGDNGLVGPEVMILTATHELVEGRVSGTSVGRDVTIGNRVWLGARCTILPGVTVGDGCVIAAGAVVVRSCEPEGLYAGVPARRVRSLVSVPEEADPPKR